MPIARGLGAEVIEQPWLGFPGQREFALRLPQLSMTGSTSWTLTNGSHPVGGRIAGQLRTPSCAGFSHRLRLVFQGRWIRHCGWYPGSWVVRLVDRRYTKYDGSLLGERACVDGKVRRLRHDIVDDDRKGLAAWLHKHVRYAELEAERRSEPTRLSERLQSLRIREDTRPLVRALFKDVLFPSVPGKPAALFFYMYVIRLGLLDGGPGLRFCLYHAWFELSVGSIRQASRQDSRRITP